PKRVSSKVSNSRAVLVTVKSVPLIAAMQESSTSAVGSFKNARAMLMGQGSAILTPCPIPGYKKYWLLPRVEATCSPHTGGVMGSNSPAKTRVGISLLTASFSIGSGVTPCQFSQRESIFTPKLGDSEKAFTISSG